MLQETKCNEEDGDKFVRYYKGWSRIFQIGEGHTGGSEILWKDTTISITVIDKRKNWISCRIQSKLCLVEFFLWNIYGPTKLVDKAMVWDEVSQDVINNGNEKFNIGYDFKAILDLTEKNGGTNKVTRDMIEFRKFVNKLGAQDYISSSGWFTWTNRRLGFTNITKPLDRFLFGPQWIIDNTPLTVTTLSCSVSDHFPMQLEIGNEINWGWLF
ncbi:hypothetical protein SUGI_0023680 [Cryptomeria japonica]|nr:hypothetical protein SUGI_0023680 [Cryptomeria japonica]